MPIVVYPLYAKNININESVELLPEAAFRKQVAAFLDLLPS